MSSTATRILLVTGDRILRECLGFTLRQLGMRTHEASFDCSGTDLPRLRQFVPDVLLAGPRFDPAIDKLMETVHEVNPDCRFLILINSDSGDSLMEFAISEADGCITEDASVKQLEEAITTILEGRPFCTPHLANELFVQIGRYTKRSKWSEHLKTVRLTQREVEVLELIAHERLGNKQIGRRLSISLYTVKNHVHNIIEKLGVCDRHEAAEMMRSRCSLSPIRFTREI